MKINENIPSIINDICINGSYNFIRNIIIYLSLIIFIYLLIYLK